MIIIPTLKATFSIEIRSTGFPAILGLVLQVSSR